MRFPFDFNEKFIIKMMKIAIINDQDTNRGINFDKNTCITTGRIDCAIDKRIQSDPMPMQWRANNH